MKSQDAHVSSQANWAPVSFLKGNKIKCIKSESTPEQASYLTVPSETLGTDRVTSREIWHWLRKMDIIRRASTSLRGAFTEAQPKYVSLLNTTLSSSVTGVKGLKSSQPRVRHKAECEKKYQASSLYTTRHSPSFSNLPGMVSLANSFLVSAVLPPTLG